MDTLRPWSTAGLVAGSAAAMLSWAPGPTTVRPSPCQLPPLQVLFTPVSVSVPLPLRVPPLCVKVPIVDAPLSARLPPCTVTAPEDPWRGPERLAVPPATVSAPSRLVVPVMVREPPVIARELELLTVRPKIVLSPVDCWTAKPELSTAISSNPGRTPPLQLLAVAQSRPPAALVNTQLLPVEELGE